MRRAFPPCFRLVAMATLASVPFLLATAPPVRAAGEATTVTYWHPAGVPSTDLAFDSFRNRLVACGTSTAEAEFFTLDLAPGATWQRLVLPGSFPPVVVGRSVAYDPSNDRVVAQGGNRVTRTCLPSGLPWSDYDTEPGAWAHPLAAAAGWSFVAGPAIEGTPLVADAARQRFLLYGGTFQDCHVSDGSSDCDQQVNLRDLWQLDWASGAWTKLAEAGPDFNYGVLVAAVDPVRDRLVVVRARTPRTVHAYSLTDASGWSELATTGTQPSLVLDRAEYDPGTDALLLFAGDSVTTLTLGATPTWQPLPTAGAGATVRAWDPLARKAWGYAQGGPVFELDAATWTWSAFAASPAVAQSDLKARKEHAVAYDALTNRTYVMGGVAGLPATPPTCISSTAYWSDLWSMGDAGPEGWWFEASASGLLAMGAYDMGLIHDPARNRLVLVSGATPLASAAAWTLNVSAPSGWASLAVGGTPPAERSIGASAYDPTGDRMLCFGGPPGDALWAITLGASPAWQHLAIAGEPGTAVDYERAAWDPVRGRLWVLDPATMALAAIDVAGAGATWQAVAVAGTPPPVGPNFLLTYDGARDRLVVACDGPGTFLWAIPLQGPEWTQVPFAGTAPAVNYDASLTYDAARDRVLLLGGGSGPGLWDTPTSALFVIQFGVDSATAVAVARVSQDATPARVRLEWQVSDAAGATFELSRSKDALAWTRIAAPRAGDDGRLVAEDRDVRAGARYGYRLATTEGGETRVLDEVWVNVPAGLATRLVGARPNPAQGGVRVAFALADDAPATLELLDVQGRALARLEVGALGAGEHVLPLPAGRRLAAGVYFARLTSGGEARTVRVSVLD